MALFTTRKPICGDAIDMALKSRKVLCSEQTHRLDLHSNQAVFPDSDIWCSAVLAVVEEDDHAVWVHGFADEELVVLEFTDDLLGEALGARLEFLDLFLGSALFLEAFLDLLHVGLEVGQVGLLVKGCLRETKTVSNVQDRRRGILQVFVAALGRGVAADVEGLAADRDLLAVRFVGDVVDELEVVRIRDDFVSCEEILVDDHFCDEYRGSGGG